MGGPAERNELFRHVGMCADQKSRFHTLETTKVNPLVIVHATIKVPEKLKEYDSVAARREAMNALLILSVD